MYVSSPIHSHDLFVQSIADNVVYYLRPPTLTYHEFLDFYQLFITCLVAQIIFIY